MRDGDTHYGPPAGLPGLREAIVRRDAVRSGVSYDPADVIVTPGGKFALLTALMGVVQAGDEVLVPEPGWVSYGPCVRLCGGTQVGIWMLDRIDAGALEAVVSPRTKAMIINSPVNPTGRVFSAAEIETVLASPASTISGSCSTRSIPTCSTKATFPIRAAGWRAAGSACS